MNSMDAETHGAMTRFGNHLDVLENLHPMQALKHNSIFNQPFKRTGRAA